MTTVVEKPVAQSPDIPGESEPERPDSVHVRVEELRRLRAEVHAGPGVRATRAQHDRGKLTARERIELLLDEGSFTELEPLRRHRATGFGLEKRRPHTDGVITGWGTVEGRQVFVYAHDFRIFGGALGESHAAKIHKLMDLAEASGAPLVSLCDGAGCPYPGGRHGARRIRRDLQPQRPVLGGDPADQRDPRAVCGRRRVFMRR